jgi:hypothetical protein
MRLPATDVIQLLDSAGSKIMENPDLDMNTECQP